MVIICSFQYFRLTFPIQTQMLYLFFAPFNLRIIFQLKIEMTKVKCHILIRKSTVRQSAKCINVNVKDVKFQVTQKYIEVNPHTCRCKLCRIWLRLCMLLMLLSSVLIRGELLTVFLAALRAWTSNDSPVCTSSACPWTHEQWMRLTTEALLYLHINFQHVISCLTSICSQTAKSTLVKGTK